ncbi:MAG: hypothetical protein ABFS35_09395 [Bacteroidota bacterium]
MRVIGLVVFFCFISLTTYSQDEGNNTVSLEVFPIETEFTGGRLMLNYEHLFSWKHNLLLRAGIWPDFQNDGVTFLLTVQGLTGRNNKHNFEYGIGSAVIIDYFEDKTHYGFVPDVLIGYRFHMHKGFMFRTTVNLFVGWPTMPSLSFSAGYRF